MRGTCTSEAVSGSAAKGPIVGKHAGLQWERWRRAPLEDLLDGMTPREFILCFTFSVTRGIAVVVTGAPLLAWCRQSPVCAREVDSNRRRRIAAPKLRPNHPLARRDRVARSAEQRAGVRIRLPPYRPRPAHIPPRVSIIVHRQLPVLNPWATSPASRLEGKVNGGEAHCT